MSNIRYKNNVLFVENVSVKRLTLKHKSPFYFIQIIILLKIIESFSIILKK